MIFQHAEWELRAKLPPPQSFCFPLPPLLRALYFELANGGFGPGAGLRGAIGGFGAPGTFQNGNDETLVKYHLRGSESLIDQPLFQHVPQVLLPSNRWPRLLAPLCDLGCAVEVCIDANGQLYRLGPTEENFVSALRPWQPLEQWLHNWLAGAG